jgi:thiosulfate/3-mercaptopyruvate sulfurtransferase
MTQRHFGDLKSRSNGIAVALCLFFLAGAAQAELLPGPLVDVDWLENNADKVTLLDVRADVDSFRKRSKGKSPVNPCGAGVKGKEAEPVAGHIPGAVLVRWSLLTTQRKIAGKKTDGWLPEAADFERLMQKSGVGKDSHIVIAYKGERTKESALAARLMFTLKYYGHDAVAILNGGTAAWIESGRKVKFGRSKSRRGDFLAKPGRTQMVATLADVKAISKSGAGQLLDVRNSAGYFGVASKIAAVHPKWYGHIPGASNLPVTMLSNDVGPVARLFDTDTLQQVLALSGAKPDAPSVLYCNSGIMASLGWFVLSELFGNTKVSLYDGSMQEWSLEKMPVIALKRK